MAPLAPHRGVAVSREWELTTSASKTTVVDLEGAFAECAPASIWLAMPSPFHRHAPPHIHTEPLASFRYAPASFWLADPSSSGGPRPYLLMPLNEMQDEHYTVYMCKPSTPEEADQPPGFCK